uniref:uncharacterized protein LOC120348145 n=1 Tax=Styela clava TaxID=7725 RepID=UPI0019393033|nr:uncharacterized protein LOC120348145 [Styela clava]
MKEIVLVILYAFLENCASKGWMHKRLPDIQGNVTYNDFSITDHHTNNPTHVGHVLFIYITRVSMHITAETTCTAELKLSKMESICLTPEVRCIFYQPIGCNFDYVADFDGFECDKYAWFVLPELPLSPLKIGDRSDGEKIVQLQYKYFECPTENSSIVTDVSTITNPDPMTPSHDPTTPSHDPTTPSHDPTTLFQKLSTNGEIVKTDSETQMCQGKIEMTVGLLIALALLVVSWVVFGVVFMRNRSKVTSRNPDVGRTGAEESNTREILVNAIYGDNFGRMGDDSQPSSSNAVYSVVNKRRQTVSTPPR